MADETKVTITFRSDGIEPVTFPSLKYVTYQKIYDIYQSMVKGFQMALEVENRKTLVADLATRQKVKELSDEEKRDIARDNFYHDLTEKANG